MIGKISKILGLIAVAVLLEGSFAWQAQAASSNGAANISNAARNFTPIQRAACGGRWGPYCPPGRTRVCGPFRCWCAPC
jgi:hypothetical protein